MRRGPIARLALTVAMAGLSLVCLAAEGSAADRRIALVIGNSAYRNAPALTNPVRDAQSIADMLKAAGFDSVELKQNLESLDLKRAIRAFMLNARDADVAAVFFAGHGIEVNGTNYLIPVDAKLRTDFDAEDEGVGLDRIIRAVEPARRLRLIILDACRDNPFINLMQRTASTRAISAGLGKVEPESSDTLVAYAARAGSFAEDGRSDHSPFTTALLKHLPSPGLDIRVAFGRVRDDVMRDTGGKQEPFVYGSLGGSTVSIMRETAAPAPPSRDPSADIRRDYEFAERVGTRDGWTYFLQAHPTGFFADLARAQLTKFPDKPVQVAKVDVSKPETRSPTLTPPVTPPLAVAMAAPPALPVPVTAQPPAKGPPAPAPVVDRDPCERDRETLGRLRDEQVVADILRFARDLKCEALRPQITRLLESTGSPGDLARPDPAKIDSAKLDAAKPGSARPEPAAAKPPETAALPPRPAPSSSTPPVPPERSSAAACEAEGQTLARLRSAPDLAAVDRFAREMTCKPLKPQVMRLRESLAD